MANVSFANCSAKNSTTNYCPTVLLRVAKLNQILHINP